MKLVIAEKPSVAKSIADVLGAKDRKDGYLEGNGYLVTWCVGHLVELAQPEMYDAGLKKWTYESLPIVPKKWINTVKEDTRSQYRVIEKLMSDKRVETVVCSTDSGREGELIFRLVYEQAGCKKPFERLWISSMEESAIQNGFAHLRPGADYDSLYESALCRQRADWLVGINATRLFTVLYGKTVKIGRVQTPTLAMLVDREAAIMDFKKEKYYLVHIEKDGLDAVSAHLTDKKEADEIARACQEGQALVIAVNREKKSEAAPKLYDLTTLQRDANRIFGFTAKQTLEYTQSLYEKKLCTYPRTDSQYLSDDMEDTARGVIGAVYGAILFEEQAGEAPDIKRIMDSRKVTDHHAIIPTMEIAAADLAALPEGEMKILSLVANRLLCATGEKHEYETVKAEIECANVRFTAAGRTVLKNGWKSFEAAFRRSYRIDQTEEERGEKKLPELTEGQIFGNVQARVVEHFTNPPRRYTEDLLLASMERAGNAEMDDDVERKGLGTPATRADIIEKLVKDGYVKRDKKQLIPTDEGIKLITVLPDIIKSPKLTVDWENALARIAKGELGSLDFMADIEMMVSNLVDTYHEVSGDQKKLFAGTQETLGKCPHCGGDVVMGKNGAYCKDRCGMNVGRYYKTVFTDRQIKNLLAGERILLRGLKGKDGKDYDLYLKPTGIEQYSYEKDGHTLTGYQFCYEKSYPKRKS